MDALALIVDLETAPEAFILNEFKSLIHHLANTHFRSGKSGYSEVAKDYWDHCTLKSLDYIPKEWNNSETVVYNCETGEVTII
jgi:hypothetical protein